MGSVGKKPGLTLSSQQNLNYTRLAIFSYQKQRDHQKSLYGS